MAEHGSGVGANRARAAPPAPGGRADDSGIDGGDAATPSAVSDTTAGWPAAPDERAAAESPGRWAQGGGRMGFWVAAGQRDG